MLGGEFGDDLSVQSILPCVAVHPYYPNPEHTYTYNKCGGRELNEQPVFVGTAGVRGTKNGF